MTRIHFLALMSLLGGSLVLAGCGDDGGGGDPAGGSGGFGGAMGGSGGSGGDGGSGGTGGGIMCENHEGTCTRPLPLVTEACCTDEGRCGVTSSFFTSYDCVWIEGETSDECPDETATADDFTDAGTAETDAGAADAGEPQGITLPGCCKPNNQCGIELSFGGFSLGVCIQRSDVMEQDLEDVGCTYQGE